MKPKREFLDYLRDIQEALEKLEEFTRGMNFEAFAEDDKTSFAVIRALSGDHRGSRQKDSQIRALPLPGYTLAGYGGDAG